MADPVCADIICLWRFEDNFDIAGWWTSSSLRALRCFLNPTKAFSSKPHHHQHHLLLHEPHVHHHQVIFRLSLALLLRARAELLHHDMEGVLTYFQVFLWFIIVSDMIIWVVITSTYKKLSLKFKTAIFEAIKRVGLGKYLFVFLPSQASFSISFGANKCQ